MENPSRLLSFFCIILRPFIRPLPLLLRSVVYLTLRMSHPVVLSTKLIKRTSIEHLGLFHLNQRNLQE